MKYYKRNICNSCGKEKAPLSIFNDKIQQKKFKSQGVGFILFTFKFSYEEKR